MLTESYNATSERQNEVSTPDFQSQTPDKQRLRSEPANIFSIHNSDAEKSAPVAQLSTDRNTPSTKTSDEFSFQDKNTFAFTPSSPQAQPGSPVQTSRPITVTPDKGKCVTGIVVYYSDSTFQTFIPDVEGKHPFMMR